MIAMAMPYIVLIVAGVVTVLVMGFGYAAVRVADWADDRMADVTFDAELADLLDEERDA